MRACALLFSLHSPSSTFCRSIHIVALGSECPTGVGPGGDEIMGQGQLQGGLLWSYLGHGALVGPCDLESSLHNPAFMEYTSRVFGDVTVVVRDCPSWVRDTFGAVTWEKGGGRTKKTQGGLSGIGGLMQYAARFAQLSVCLHLYSTQECFSLSPVVGKQIRHDLGAGRLFSFCEGKS